MTKRFLIQISKMYMHMNLFFMLCRMQAGCIKAHLNILGKIAKSKC
jgi:hypothetical protein